MEELRRLEKFQSVVSAITCHGLLSSSTSDTASSRFLSNLVLFLVQWELYRLLLGRYFNPCLLSSRQVSHQRLVHLHYQLLFIRFYSREDTEDVVEYISGTILDDRPIRVDFDW